MDATQKANMKKKKTRFFETYICKVLKQISPCNGITANSKQQLNSVICLISKLLAGNVISLTEIAKKKTVSEKEVKNALRITLPKQLASNAITEGQKAIDTYEEESNVKGASRQDKAGIMFPPAQAEKFLRNFGYSKVMITSNAPVFLAGALEYLTAEILENSAASAKENKRVRITIRDLEMAVRKDDELDTFFITNNITFLGGGVTPFVHPSLLAKKNRKKRTKKSQESEDKKKHRFRPGTVSLREIRRFQKMSNCLTFAKFPFEKFVREIVAKNYTGDVPMKISKDVFIILQYFIEQKLVDILRNANFAAIHAGRVKLMPIDIDFVRAIASGTYNPYQKCSIDPSQTPEVENDDDEKEEEIIDEDEDDEDEDDQECDVEGLSVDGELVEEVM
jgi:histone H3/H4